MRQHLRKNNIQSAPLLTPRWYPLAPHPEHIRLINSTAQYKVVPAGRRSGKTERAKRHVIGQAIAAVGDSPNFFCAAPTRDQAKRIYWNDLKAMVPPHLRARRPIETDLIIELINGATIQVLGMDKPERIEGTPWNGGILDEYANMKEQTWPENVRPALADRSGWCWLIGVPEGRNHYYDVYKYARADTTGLWDAFTWTSAEVLVLYGKGHEVDAARHDLDPLTFAQEFEASFVNFAGQAYYQFNEAIHCGPVRDQYRATADLHFCFDFNVDPGVAAVIQELAFPVREKVTGLELDGVTLIKDVDLTEYTIGTAVIGEVHIPVNSNTPAVCNKLLQDWGAHNGRVMIWGDATGGARGTAQTEGSDWDLVKNAMYSHYGAERVFFNVPDANPTERSRLNAVNSRLKTAAGEVNLMVDPRHAPNVVRDFEGVRLLEGGSGEIDKKADPKLSHLTDGIGYYIEKRYPVRRDVASISYA